MLSKLSMKVRAALTAVFATALCVGALVAAPLISSAQATGTTSSAASLPPCGFWAPDVSAPPRSVTPWVPPLQIAAAFNYSTRQTAPTITGTMVNGQETITVTPVANAVAYKVWRDGVTIGYISYWGQTTPLTVTDTTPCANSYYDVIAMYDTNNNDASYGQLSVPYWLNGDGSIAPGSGSAAPGTKLSNFMVTSYDNTGPTATGYNAQSGICATDPRYIPWGTYFSIPDYGTCVAGDLGTWIQGSIVDVWLPNPQAGNWGVQKRDITIIANPYVSTTPPSSPSSTSSTGTSSPSSPPASGGCTAAAWNSSTAYTGGAVVSYNGHTWTAKWWTQGDTPGSNSSGVWTDGGACTGGGSTSSAPASSSAPATSSAPPTTTSSPSATSTSSGSCAPAWNANTTYTTGQVVSYNGHNYTATWTSAGAVPNAATSWASWKDNGPC